jgi:uncharacterized protein
MTAGRTTSLLARGGRGVTVGLVALLCTLVLAFAVTFPALTGRVVDQANILSADTRNSVELKLADLEAKSGIQLVVATVKSLEGQEIEPYANELFRTWKLGQKDKNNGVLLLVAPNEKRVRIEVGYGLEGTLTDALSKVIITNAIAPRFKAGNYGDGIARGVDDIITVLTTDASEWQQKPSLRLDAAQTSDPTNWILLAALFGLIVLLIVSPGFRSFFFNFLLSAALSGRIVDQANIIPADTRAAIEPKLADLETKSGIQLVVATVSSLEGQEIEPYANELFRSWKLGEKAKNNGVLLLVAPNEHRVRIEVGYGLEGTLTDALSKVIITNAIAPRFKTGDFGGGIARGVDDIITVLTTDAS